MSPIVQSFNPPTPPSSAKKPAANTVIVIDWKRFSESNYSLNLSLGYKCIHKIFWHPDSFTCPTHVINTECFLRKLVFLQLMSLLQVVKWMSIPHLRLLGLSLQMCHSAVGLPPLSPVTASKKGQINRESIFCCTTKYRDFIKQFLIRNIFEWSSARQVISKLTFLLGWFYLNHETDANK